MGLGKILVPRLRKVEGIRDIRVQAGSQLHVRSDSTANRIATAVSLVTPQGASEPELTPASTRSIHPLRMQPPNWNEMFASKAQGVSPSVLAGVEEQAEPPLSPEEQTESLSTPLEAQTEADLKEVVPTNLRPIMPASTCDIPYGWKTLDSCVGWGRHFRGFEVNDQVMSFASPTFAEVIVIPPSPRPLRLLYGHTLLSQRMGIEGTGPSPSTTPFNKPQLIMSHLPDGEFANGYRVSNRKDLKPRTYNQQLDSKTSQSTQIRLLKGNIPTNAYLNVPQLRHSRMVRSQYPHLERPQIDNFCDAQNNKQLLRMKMDPGKALDTSNTLLPTNTLPTRPKAHKTKISVGQVLELPTLAVRTNAAARPLSYPRYYSRKPTPPIILSGEKAREILPVHSTPSTRRWSFTLNIPGAVMTSAVTSLEPQSLVTNNRGLPPCLRIHGPDPPTSHESNSPVPSIPSISTICSYHSCPSPRTAPTTPRRPPPHPPVDRAPTLRDVDRMVAFHRDRRLSLVLRASKRGHAAVAELREVERMLKGLARKRSGMFMARVAAVMLEDGG